MCMTRDINTHLNSFKMGFDTSLIKTHTKKNVVYMNKMDQRSGILAQP